jgi:hypothetical protein
VAERMRVQLDLARFSVDIVVALLPARRGGHGAARPAARPRRPHQRRHQLAGRHRRAAGQHQLQQLPGRDAPPRRTPLRSELRADQAQPEPAQGCSASRAGACMPSWR